MAKYTRLRVSGFRRILNLDMPLGPLTVIVGVNGCGKSSILDALWLCSASAAGQLKNMIQAFGGFHSFVSKGRAQSVTLGLSASHSNGDRFDYRFSLVDQGTYVGVEKEILERMSAEGKPLATLLETETTFRKEGRLLRPLEVGESHLFQASGAFNLDAELFRGPLLNTRLLRSPSVTALRAALPRIGVKRPLADGRGLAESLMVLALEAPEQFGLLVDSLRAIFPRLERLEAIELVNSTLTLGWWDADYPNSPFFPHQLSDGTLRLLFMMTSMYAVYEDERTNMLLIDEPEVSLHPEAIGTFAGYLREASEWTQIVVATHSVDLVRRLKPEEIVAVDIAGDGSSTVRRGDEMNLSHWLEDYSMDELWRMGEIGGRS